MILASRRASGSSAARRRDRVEECGRAIAGRTLGVSRAVAKQLSADPLSKEYRAAWTATINHRIDQLLLADDGGLTLVTDEQRRLLAWNELTSIEPGSGLELADGSKWMIELYEPTARLQLAQIAPDHLIRVSPPHAETNVAEPHPSPGLQRVQPSDRIIEGCALLLCAGIPNSIQLGQPGPVAVRSHTLEVWGLDALGEHQALQIDRTSIIDVDVSGGEMVQRGGGFIGGGLDLAGAAIGLAAAAFANALTTRTSREPVLLVITTTEGVVVMITTSVGALELRGMLAPILVDEIRNRGRIATPDEG